MIIPKLRKERTVKIYHGHKLADDYAFVDQANILQILKKPDLILPEVRKYIESNNELTKIYRCVIITNLLYFCALFNNIINKKRE